MTEQTIPGLAKWGRQETTVTSSLRLNRVKENTTTRHAAHTYTIHCECVSFYPFSLYREVICCFFFDRNFPFPSLCVVVRLCRACVLCIAALSGATQRTRRLLSKEKLSTWQGEAVSHSLQPDSFHCCLKVIDLNRANIMRLLRAVVQTLTSFHIDTFFFDSWQHRVAFTFSKKGYLHRDV